MIAKVTKTIQQNSEVFMPLLWKYIGSRILKFLGLFSCIFLSIGLLLRYKYILFFWLSSGSIFNTLCLLGILLLYSIKDVFIPVVFLSAFFTMYSFSHSNETKAFFYLGYKPRELFFPFYYLGALCICIHAIFASEISPYAKQVIQSSYAMSKNPLILLRKQEFPILKKGYVECSLSQKGKSAEDIFLVGYNENTQSLVFLAADQLSYQKDFLQGDNISWITTFSKGVHTDLFLETVKHMQFSPNFFSSFLEQKHPPLEQDRLKTLIENKAYTKALVKISNSLLALPLMILGAFCGIFLQKKSPKRSYLYVCILTVGTYFLSLLDKKPLFPCVYFAAVVFLSVHLILWGCIWKRSSLCA